MRSHTGWGLFQQHFEGWGCRSLRLNAGGDELWQFWLHEHAVRLFKWFYRKFEFNNVCGFSVSGNYKLQVNTLWKNEHHRPSCRNVDLNSSNSRLLWIPQTTTSSVGWRRSSLVDILTVKMMSSLLWISFWRSKVPNLTKNWSFCSTTAGLSVWMC